jgi:GNAT superfamily N-acetyltransferase
MCQVLARLHELTCSVVTSAHDLPWRALLDLLAEAWGADYRQQRRIALDEAFLRRLMPACPVWVACLLHDRAGHLRGFELAIQRTLYWHAQVFPAYATRLLTIHPDYRRRGYGRWLLQCLHHVLFAQRDAALVLATLHIGHAGLPTVQQTYAALPDWQMQCVATAPVWGCRLDRVALPPLAPTVHVRRLAMSPDGRAWLADSAAPARRSPLTSPEAFRHALRQHYALACDLDGSFRTQYLRAETPDAGTYGYHFGDGAVCSISYELGTLLAHEHIMGRLGRIQAVSTFQCTTGHLSQALAHMCHVFTRAGCVLASLSDLGGVPHQVLRALGFRPTGDVSLVTVRGRRTVLEALRPVHPPVFVDV